jgi:hypothetical protein
MANVARLYIYDASSSVVTPSAGAASFTVPLDYADTRAALVVDNANTDVIARVRVNAGDGIRSCLGDLDVDIAASKAAAIPLADSMRFKTATTQSVTVQLLDTADTDLTAGPLAKIKCILIQG